MSYNHPRRDVDDPRLTQAIRVIETKYGDIVSVEKKAKNVFKFGRNDTVGTDAGRFTVWATGQDDAHETYVADGTNSIDSVSSDNAGDAQAIVVEGHTSAIDNDGNANKTFVTQSATLNGQTKVTLTTPLNRVSRMYNNDSTDFAGEVYCYESTAITSGKPNDTAKIHATILRGNQTEKAATSLSSVDYYIITELHISVLEKSAAFADVALEIREQGKIFRHHANLSSSGGGVDFHTQPYLIVPKNADVRLTAIADGAGTDVSAAMNGYLAIVV